MPADVRDFHLRNICRHSYFHGYYSATVGNGMGYHPRVGPTQESMRGLIIRIVSLHVPNDFHESLLHRCARFYEQARRLAVPGPTHQIILSIKQFGVDSCGTCYSAIDRQFVN